MPEHLKIYTDRNRVINLSKDHSYHSQCQCYLCRLVRDGVSKGEISIWSHDGQVEYVLPKPNENVIK